MSLSYDLSLTQANKLLPSLKSLHKQYNLVPSDKKKLQYPYNTQPVASKVTNKVSVTWSTSNPFTQEQFAEQMKAKIANDRAAVEFSLSISEDLRKFKSVVFRANLDSGVDQVLSELELLSEQRKIFDALHKECLKADANTIAKDLNAVYTSGIAAVTKDGAVAQNFTATQLVYTNEELVERLGTISKRIRELEAKRDELNSRTKVTLVFNPLVAKLLGL